MTDGRTDGRPKLFATNVRHSSADLQLWRLPRLTLDGHHSRGHLCKTTHPCISRRLLALVIIHVPSPYFSCPPPPLVCSFSLPIGIRRLSFSASSITYGSFLLISPCYTLFLLREYLSRFLFLFLTFYFHLFSHVSLYYALVVSILFLLRSGSLSFASVRKKNSRVNKHYVYCRHAELSSSHDCSFSVVQRRKSVHNLEGDFGKTISCSGFCDSD